ncbi:MAG: trypsin-like peptidase domain-containing protein [Nitrososphaeria archaeon]|nr:trypsin-like peptidase domain-containing protein [Aigarchaeota archaeon]MCX8187064.1 trypsin-like peptidase domain-containing protein [Nitrososphaeria archaeon]MDW8021642.1 trypsin-like peptidase domain-containing protein [Nitrososphaerota archaeon]
MKKDFLDRGLLEHISKEINNLVEEVWGSVASVITTRVRMDAFLRLIPVRGVGSAFVVSSDGYLATNNHVVAEAESIELLVGGRSLEGRVVARSPSRDISLLKVMESGLKPLKLGNSDEIEVGELVLAIGSPLGLPGPNVSLGVVSAVGRTIEGEGFILEDLIQTDAAINPGNSGGPLLNMRGEVVGMTTAMIPYAQGIGFAIPINAIKRFMEMVSKHGRALRPWIGVITMPLNEHIARYLSLGVSEGLLIIRTIRESPAYLYGIREGDVIVEADGHEVRRISDLRRILEDSMEKGRIKLKVVRERRALELEVPVAIEEEY